jgi:hypothetical protein
MDRPSASPVPRKRRPATGEGSKAARACRECWSLLVEYIGKRRERCTMCGHEQDSRPGEYLEDDEEDQIPC